MYTCMQIYYSKKEAFNIFKNGCRKEVSNYRPIACLPVLSKVFEKVVFNQIHKYLSMNNILSPNQFGFQPGKST